MLNFLKRFWLWWFPKRGNYVLPYVITTKQDFYAEHFTVLDKEEPGVIDDFDDLGRNRSTEKP